MFGKLRRKLLASFATCAVLFGSCGVWAQTGFAIAQAEDLGFGTEVPEVSIDPDLPIYSADSSGGNSSMTRQAAAGFIFLTLLTFQRSLMNRLKRMGFLRLRLNRRTFRIPIQSTYSMRLALMTLMKVRTKLRCCSGTARRKRIPWTPRKLLSLRSITRT